MKERIVLIGAGSAMFTRGIVADLIRSELDADLVLVDVAEEALQVAEGLARKMVTAGGASIGISGHTDRREALPGATAVITTVGVGGRRAWEQDVFIPRKYGINYPVGDSVGPGGSSRALRMIPAMVDIARDVLELAPDALFFNYANPMPVVCRAIRKATGAPVTGLCHGVNQVAGELAKLLGVPRAEFTYNAVGINHLTWFTAVGHGGRDLMPDLMASSDFRQGDRFTSHLLRLFKAFPAVHDRHVVEFFPQFFREGDYFGTTLGVDEPTFERTIQRGDQIFENMKEIALSEAPLPEKFLGQTSGEHEQVLDVIRSLRTDAGVVYSANLPNEGTVANLPSESIIEAPARADSSGLVHLPQGPLPAGIVGTLATRFAWVETIVEAGLEGNRDKFVQALILDGGVSSMQMAEEMADEFLAAQAEYLPQFAVPVAV